MYCTYSVKNSWLLVTVKIHCIIIYLLIGTFDPFTVKTCRSLSGPKYGRISSIQPSYDVAGRPSTVVYTQGVKVKFACDMYYRLVLSSSMTCLPSGYWSNIEPRCGKYIIYFFVF